MEKIQKSTLKPKDDNYNEKLDEIAIHCMKSILEGIYSSPIMLAQLDEIAIKHNYSLAKEIAERSYVMAGVMIQMRKEYLKTGTNETT